MNDDKMIPVSVFERAQETYQKSLFRLWITLIITILITVGTNVAWIIYENQFTDQITVTQETPSGNNNYVGRDGSITNGESTSQ